ncbi:phospholipase D-like domain-containing protein [Hymenobacter daeguensis]
MVTPHFTGIRKAILEALDKATEEILVAVYWFTNAQLFSVLCNKVREGKKVSIIVHNDFINNREAGLDFQSFIDLGGRFYFSTSEYPMHNKFCVIDNQILINGSYNWTYFAETKNSENILIIRNEQEAVSAFHSEFMNLTKHLRLQTQVRRLTTFELDEFNGLSARDYLANDIVFEAQATNRPELVEAAFKLVPRNLNVQQVAVQLDLTKKRRLTCSIGAGLKDNKYLVGVEKGTVLPVSISRIVCTSVDNQESCASTVYYGNADRANSNKALGKVEVSRLPKKPAGEAELKFIFTIDVYGELWVQFYSLDNGRRDTLTANINGLLAGVPLSEPASEVN